MAFLKTISAIHDGICVALYDLLAELWPRGDEAVRAATLVVFAHICWALSLGLTVGILNVDQKVATLAVIVPIALIYCHWLEKRIATKVAAWKEQYGPCPEPLDSWRRRWRPVLAIYFGGAFCSPIVAGLIAYWRSH